ncbi:MmcQ/YjbR family DNA-binding protein [Roseibium sp.]|uniref:MmcQ/YjbR family DNA-binding protein n=1 Tax=Roseibium sp. TaxID=1936156 RepID=UPI003A982A82
MTRTEFDAYCAGLPATTNVVQWGNASVWKVGGKIFAVCSSWGEGSKQRIAFKCSDLSYMMLTEEDGIVPAPYLARAKWVQVSKDKALSDEDLKTYISTAHGLVAGKLTKKLRQELGIDA